MTLPHNYDSLTEFPDFSKYIHLEVSGQDALLSGNVTLNIVVQSKLTLTIPLTSNVTLSFL